jgi:predicted acyltransferase
MRYQSLDVLRGLAILGMVLSGSIAYGDVLPAWMFHAQVPPPNHKFNPNLPGITWVDLVFPFFLFAMGAAIPLALNRRLEKGEKIPGIIWHISWRFVQLAWFAFFFEHAKPLLFANAFSSPWKWLTAIGAFGLFWLAYGDVLPAKINKVKYVVQAAVMLAGLLAVQFIPYANDTVGFSLKRVDIIILVLANMSLFGGLIWLATRHLQLLRLGVLPLIMAIFLSASLGDAGWQHWLYNLTPEAGIYKFYFLKYLFIIIPGTFAGEALMKAQASHAGAAPFVNPMVGVLAPVFITLLNLWFLFERSLTLNLLFTALFGTAFLFWWWGNRQKDAIINLFVPAGMYLLLLGLAFETYEGGIKKDHSTYSYYFVSSGLAFLLLAGFYVAERQRWMRFSMGVLAATGQNPLVAYVAGALVLYPVMALTGILPFWNGMNQNAFMGLMKGVLFTGVVAAIAVYFTRRRWFWKA